MSASITSPLVHALETAWIIIQARHADVPDVVLTIGSGSIGAKVGTLRLGHFAAERWQHDSERLPELFVSGEGLRRGAADVLGTLLHEAAHGLAHTRHIQDTSRQGRYHNQKFRAIAEELGLTVENDPRIGWSVTTVPPETADRYADTITAINHAITAYRHAEQSTTTKPGGGSNLAVALCLCSRKIRVAPSTLEQASITCQACGHDFRTA
ncbi:hypothetical protein [Amycolatopsis saalfeldensis]|uniref:SprT-like family protein n=1 Tax=Amycolatopsis saalfeldensis TaxID=394193 RepID=A0A1H8YK10_9PSEU|nr:hypothetical protein [Amycolatopsis saalfeldensis]SEP52423.1 SprT-like family protein [Amycolatopsis saalfeldensis]